MKLLTHNMMTSKCIKGVRTGFPLGIVASSFIAAHLYQTRANISIFFFFQASETKVTTVDFNPEFVCRMIPKLDWDALYQAAESIGIAADLPKALLPDYEHNEEFLRRVHHTLFEVEVVAGELVCPETGRKFPITNGIPNMLLNENEVHTGGSRTCF
ncbi:tRNA methyltransferase subunit 11-2 isoform X1 [Rhipicephalus microplus]|uniref:tRNA methyltransferase subunit 11-2 isoform X1 n=1 Tax=Rhipicephalus microplus TaxID=6941 RepID=UPI0018880E29|nr:multifunctional methyltransferase subunit TRM112-like protein isoform X1 [Rhipicephalus microplus]